MSGNKKFYDSQTIIAVKRITNIIKGNFESDGETDDRRFFGYPPKS